MWQVASQQISLKLAMEAASEKFDTTVQSSTPSLWTHCLMPADSVILLAVNDDYRNDDKGTTCKPLDRASCKVKLPAWLQPRDTFEISARGVTEWKPRIVGNEASLDLARVDLTRMIVLTHDTSLRARVRSLCQTKFAAKAAAQEDRGGPRKN